MSRFKIVNLMDKIFVSVCIFLFLFAWINFFLRSIWTTLFISVILASAITFILFTFFSYSKNKRLSSQKEKEEAELNFINFRLTPQSERIKLIETILKNEHEVRTHCGILSYSVDTKNCATIICLEHEKFDTDMLYNVLAEINQDFDNLIIICGENNVKTTNILENKHIEIIDKFTLYKSYFKKYNTFPSNRLVKKSTFSWKLFLLSFISKQKSKNYFWCGIFLVFSAIILPYLFYYLIFGSILLILAAVSKIFGNA